MKTAVYFSSLTGNTRKVAEAMAASIGCSAIPVDSGAPSERVDLCFLGGAVYATHDHGIQPELRRFIEALEPRKVGGVVLFCTGFRQDAVAIMTALLEAKGIPVAKERFFCKGKLFLVFNFGHPNGRDLSAAASFARRSLEASAATGLR